MRAVETPQSLCRCGVARCDITPPVGIYHRMWGAATHERATGIHRPLTATALVLRPADGDPASDTEQVFVAVDHCLLWAKEMRQVLEAACTSAGVAPEQTIVAFSHTHASGLMDLSRTALPGGELIPGYLKQLSERLAEIITQARAAAAPASIVYGQGRCTLAGQRDYWDDQTNQFVCGFNPDAPADDTVLVARIADGDGRALASVVNYACHPTTLAWGNTLISPDFPGAMREVIERETGVPALFIQGASGDLGPREGYVGDVDVADKNGRLLGYAALAALESLPPPLTRFEYTGPVVSGATLGTWSHVPLDDEARQAACRWQVRRFNVNLPLRTDLGGEPAIRKERDDCRRRQREAQTQGDSAQARDQSALAERAERWLTRLAALPQGDHFALPVTLLLAGGAVWLAVEGEPYNILQRSLRERFPRVPVIVATLANGSRPSYLPPAEIYGKGIYQEGIAVLEAGSLERLIDAIGNEMADCLADKTSH